MGNLFEQCKRAFDQFRPSDMQRFDLFLINQIMNEEVL